MEKKIKIKNNLSPEIYRLLKGISTGYLIKNYSESFRKNVTIESIRKANQGKDTYLITMFKNEYFGIMVDLKEKTIVHLNCYDKNRGFDSKKIIDYNIQLQSKKTP